MSTPSDSDVQLEVALCKAGVPQSVAYELSRLLPVVRRDAAGTVVGIEVDGALDEGVPAGGTAGQVLTKQSAVDGDAAWASPSGAGLGDVSGPAASIDGELALFDATTGKLLKRAATTGLLKATSGVLAAAVAGTDYLAPAAIGVTVQAYDADLAALAGLISGVDLLPYFTGAGTAGTTTLTAAGRSLIDDATVADMRTTLGLGTMATQAASAVAITGGSIAGITDLAIADGGTGASSAGAARTALGLEIGTNVQAFNAQLAQIAGLVDPNADRLLFWDDTAGSFAYLTLGTNLSITGTTLDATGGGSSTLDGLSDVVITGATTGQVLKYNGTNWINDTDATAGGTTALDDLSDVAITTPAAGHILRHDGAGFVNVLGTTHFQAADAGLASIAGLTTLADRSIYTTASDTYAVYTLTAGGRALAGVAGTADTLPYFSASNTASLASLSAFARTLLDDADAATARGTLGLTALATTTPGTGVATFLATPSSANLAAALTDETGSGAAVFGTSPTLTTPTISGLLTTDGAQVTSANAMGALAIDVTKGLNTKSIAADSTFTFSATATARAWFSMLVTNTDTAAHTLTIPSSYSMTRGATVTTVVIPASGIMLLTWHYDGTIYRLFAGDGFLNKYDATTAPGVGDDVADGYGAGSLWYDATGNALYICESAGAGAAVWTAISSGSAYTVGGTDVAVADGGTGASTAADARTNLGLTALATTTPGTGVATFLATPSSANLAAAVTDETGTGALVFGTAPTFPTTISVGAAAGATGQVLLNGLTSGTVTLKTADAAGTYTLTLPTGTGTASQALTTDGTGVLSWATVGGSGSVATDAIWDAAGDLAVGSGANTAARLAIGTANQLLRVNAGATGLEWATISGTGDVTKVGTPANNQLGVWTGDGTLEGDASLTFDTTTDTLAVAASGKFAFGAVNILDDSAGTTTLSNIDALDATTEATIEAAIDTLANLTSVQGHTVTLTGALIRSGAHSLTLTTTGATDVTLPTTGTLGLAAQTQGKHLIPIMATGMTPSATGGCAALATVASAANQPDIVSLDFDATTEEYAQFSIPMPEKWNEGTLTFQPIWSHASTTTNFGVVWSLQAVAVSDDDAIAVAYGTAVTSTDTGGTTNDVYVGPESSAMTVAGTPANKDTVFFRIFRTPANGSDTMAIDARLHGIRLYYTTNADTDA